MGIEEILGWAAVVAVVGFIAWRVKKAKSDNNDSGNGGGRSWKDEKYPNQNKK